jgi:hypothetical protein
MYQFWSNIRSGETFAVRIEAGSVTGACGPLAYSDVSEDLLTQMHYDDSPDDAEAIDHNRDDYALVEPEPRTSLACAMGSDGIRYHRGGYDNETL